MWQVSGKSAARVRQVWGKRGARLVQVCGKLLNVGQDVTLHDDGTDICEIKPFFLRFGAFVVFWVAMPADLTAANQKRLNLRSQFDNVKSKNTGSFF